MCFSPTWCHFVSICFELCGYIREAVPQCRNHRCIACKHFSSSQTSWWVCVRVRACVFGCWGGPITIKSTLCLCEMCSQHFILLLSYIKIIFSLTCAWRAWPAKITYRVVLSLHDISFRNWIGRDIIILMLKFHTYCHWICFFKVTAWTYILLYKVQR